MADYDVYPIPGATPSQTPLSPATTAAGSFLAPNLLDMYRRYGAGGVPYNPTVQPSGKIGDPNWARTQAGVNADLGNLATSPMMLMGAPEMLGARAASTALDQAAPDVAQALARRSTAFNKLGNLTRDVAGAGAFASPAVAGDNQTTIPSLGPRPTATPEEAKQIGDLQDQIKTLNQSAADRVKSINDAVNAEMGKTDRKGNPIYGPQNKKALAATAQQQAADAQAAIDKQVAPLQTQLDGLNSGVNARAAQWDADKADFDKKFQPIESYAPQTVGLAKTVAIPAITGMLQFKGGKIASRITPQLTAEATTFGERIARGLSRGAAYAGGAAAGAGEAGVVGALPQVYNSTQPVGSPARNQADYNSANKSDWISHDLSLDMALGAGLGAIGTRYGVMSAADKAIAAREAAAAQRMQNAGTLAAAPAAAPTAPAVSDADALKAAYAQRYGANAGSLAAQPAAPARPSWTLSDLKKNANGSYQVNKGHPTGMGGKFVSPADISDLR